MSFRVESFHPLSEVSHSMKTHHSCRAFLPLLLASAALISGISHAAQKNIELSSLVNMFLIPTSAGYNVLDWTTGASKNSPIAWKNSGIVDGSVCGLDEPYCRQGSVVATSNGKITHEVLEKTIQPGTWIITMSGARVGVDNISIASDVISRALDNSELISALTRAKIKLTPVKCKNEPASFGNTFYKLAAPGKQPAWMLNTWSCGSAGCSVEFEIYHSPRNLEGLECYN